MSHVARPKQDANRNRFAQATRLSRALAWVAWALVGMSGVVASAQVVLQPVNNAPGVFLELDGRVRVREIDPTQDLAAARARVQAAADAAKGEKLTYVSLPRLFAQVRTLREAGQPLPESLKYLGGMTRIRYVFLFPQDKDLVIAGPAEPWVTNAADPLYVTGKKTGRPVLQLDDLIVAFRTADTGRGQVFGCALDPAPDSLTSANKVMAEYAHKPRAERMNALVKASAPQKVRIFGTPEDTRFAFVCVAADYDLKRFSLGLRHVPNVTIGSAVDNSRTAANKFWFDASYEPLIVSADGDAYEIRGQRLGAKAGGFDFDPRGATEKAVAWAKAFDKDIPALCVTNPLFADLQNITDEALVGNLIRVDRLDEKVGWGDYAWVLDERACAVAKIPVPREADTLVNFTNGSIAAGGVVMTVGPAAARDARRPDTDKSLDAARSQATKLRQAPAGTSAPILATP